MISSRRNSTHASRVLPKVIGLTVFLVLLGIGDRMVLDGAVHAAARSFAAAAWGVAEQTEQVVAGSGALRSRSALASENLALRAKLAEQETVVQENLLLKTENNLLRELANIVSADTRDGGVGARILSPVASSPFATALLGAGSEDGVMAGDLVIAPGSVLVAAVTEVHTNQAILRWMFAPGFEIPALVGDHQNPITLVGRGGGNALAEVPRGAPVAEGDMVMSSDGRFVLGTVGAIRAGDIDPVQTVLIRLPFSLESLTLVRIVH